MEKIKVLQMEENKETQLKNIEFRYGENKFSIMKFKISLENENDTYNTIVYATNKEGISTEIFSSNIDEISTAIDDIFNNDNVNNNFKNITMILLNEMATNPIVEEELEEPEEPNEFKEYFYFKVKAELIIAFGAFIFGMITILIWAIKG